MFGTKKLRPDWKVKTYVIPISRLETSIEFWTEARNLKNAWNEIAAAYRAFDEKITTLEAELAGLNREKLDAGAAKASLSRIRTERKQTTLAAWKAQSPNVFNNDLENLRLGINSAFSKAYKNNGKLHFKRGIESINFCKRFKSGGIRFAELLTPLDSRDKKLH